MKRLERSVSAMDTLGLLIRMFGEEDEKRIARSDRCRKMGDSVAARFLLRGDRYRRSRPPP